MEYIKGPDFPTAATIIGLNDIKQAYETGRGSIKMSAVAGFEEIAGGGGRQARTAIVVTEIPYQVNKAQLIEKLQIWLRTKESPAFQIFVMNLTVRV